MKKKQNILVLDLFIKVDIKDTRTTESPFNWQHFGVFCVNIQQVDLVFLFLNENINLTLLATRHQIN